MKKAITFILILLNLQMSFAQEVPLYEINSNNVLDYYGQIATANLKPASTTVAAQIGNNNFIEITDTSAAMINIFQLGDNNTTLYQNINSYPGKADISIRGSNNLINIEGSNSISDGMKMNINADDMTILMRNN